MTNNTKLSLKRTDLNLEIVIAELLVISHYNLGEGNYKKLTRIIRELNNNSVDLKELAYAPGNSTG